MNARDGLTLDDVAADLRLFGLRCDVHRGSRVFAEGDLSLWPIDAPVVGENVYYLHGFAGSWGYSWRGEDGTLHNRAELRDVISHARRRVIGALQLDAAPPLLSIRGLRREVRGLRCEIDAMRSRIAEVLQALDETYGQVEELQRERDALARELDRVFRGAETNDGVIDDE